MDEQDERRRARMRIAESERKILEDWEREVRQIVGAPNHHAAPNKMPIGRP